MVTKKEFFTEKGLKAINTRVKTFCRLFNENNFPFNNMMLGFGQVDIKSKEECLSRIKELSELIDFKCRLTKINDGEIKEKIEW
jgi:hypothetical protein